MFAVLLVCQFVYAWPTKPITIVTPYSVGGITDSLARTVAEALEKKLAVPVIVKNMPGGQNFIATNHVLTQDDDYTFLVGNDDFLSGSVYSGKNYHTQFTATNILGRSPFALFGNPVSAEKFKKMIQTKDGKVTVATTGAWSGFAIWVTRELRGPFSEITIVPYKGSAQEVVDVVGQNVDFTVLSVSGASFFLDNPRLIPLVVAQNQRSKRLPDVPTYLELGLTGKPSYNNFYVYAKKGIDPAVLKTLSTSINELIHDGLLKKFQEQGLEIKLYSAVDSDKYMDTELKKYQQIKNQCDRMIQSNLV